MKRYAKYVGVGVAVALLVASQVQAITVNWSSQGVDASSLGIALADGTPVLQGGLIAIGKFNISDAAVIGLGADPTALWANFSPWATGLIGDGTSTDGSFAEASGAAGTGYFNGSIYLLAFDAGTAAGAGQVGAYKGPTVTSIGDPWVFQPTDSSPAISITTDAMLPGGVLVGSLITSGFNNLWAGADTGALKLAVVPEPSTMALIGFGLLGLIGFARRRS